MRCLDLAPRHLLSALVVILITGAGAAAQTQDSTNIRVSLDTKLDAPAAPFLVTVDKGHFKSEGLVVTVDPAAGPQESISRVASGAYDMGVADLSALIRYRDQQPNGPKAVFVVFNRAPFAVVARKSRGIAAPKDIEGKKVAVPAPDGALTALKIFARANGIDLSKVTIENVGLPVREPMLAAGQVDAITGPAFSSYVDLKSRGVPVDDIVVLLMADYGVDLYGNAIIVNPKFAADRPEAVRAFLRAFVKGLRDTVNDQAYAVEAILKRSDINKDVETERLRLAIRENILTDEVRARGFGDVDVARLRNAIDQLGIAHEFKTKPKPADVFTPEFLPSAAERAID